MQIWAAFDSDSTSDEAFHYITTLFRDISCHLTRCWMLQDLVHCPRVAISRSNMTQNHTVSHTLRNTFSLECMRFWRKVSRHDQLNNSVMHQVFKTWVLREITTCFFFLFTGSPRASRTQDWPKCLCLRATGRESTDGERESSRLARPDNGRRWRLLTRRWPLGEWLW